jgi:DNA-binding transcriptional ArsR family regulator
MRPQPSEAEVRQAARVFKALSHPDRLRLTCLLAERDEATQKELVEELGWPQSTVARHLGTLRERGLVVGRRHGTEVHLESLPLPRVLLDTVCEFMHPEGMEAAAGAASMAPAEPGVMTGVGGEGR